MSQEKPGAEPFIAELKRWRDVRGLSQSALAKAVGYTPSYVSKVEGASRGRREHSPSKLTAFFMLVGLSGGRSPRSSLTFVVKPLHTRASRTARRVNRRA